MADINEDDSEVVAPAKKKKGLSLVAILLIVVTLLLLVTISVGATLFLSGGLSGGKESGTEEAAAHSSDPAKEKKGRPAMYFSMEPAFTVNLEGEDSGRYLQVTLEVMARDPQVFEAIKNHNPMVRNELVLLFSSKRVSDLVTREGKEQLRAEALKEIQDVLTVETGKPGIESVFFTSFVMQ